MFWTIGSYHAKAKDGIPLPVTSMVTILRQCCWEQWKPFFASRQGSKSPHTGRLAICLAKLPLLKMKSLRWWGSLSSTFPKTVAMTGKYWNCMRSNTLSVLSPPLEHHMVTMPLAQRSIIRLMPSVLGEEHTRIWTWLTSSVTAEELQKQLSSTLCMHFSKKEYMEPPSTIMRMCPNWWWIANSSARSLAGCLS